MGPLEVLDAEIARRRAELHKLLDARDVLAAVFPAADAPGFTITPGPAPAEEIAEPRVELRKNPDPPPERPAGNAEPRRKPGGKADPERLAKVLRLLGEKPMTSEQIGSRLKVAALTARAFVQSHPALFFKADGNRRRPWELTPAGRAELALLPPPDPSGSAA